MAAPALAAAIPGLIQAGASLFGAKKRRAAEAKAKEQFETQKANLQNFQFENFAANQENVYEDATVNQQASQFQAQEAAKGQANLADLAAQGLLDPSQVASAQATQAQQAGADIARQEQAIQQATLGEQSRLNAAEVAGAQQLQTQQHGQVQQSFNLAQQDLSQAQAARAEARQQLVSGLASAAGGAVGAMGGGGAAAPTGGSVDFSKYTNAPKPPGLRMKGGKSAFKRLYDSYGMTSPLNQNGPGDPPEGPVWNPETKRYEGGGTEALRHEDQTGLFSGAKHYTDLRHLYGDSSYATGGENQRRISGPEFGAALDAYEKKHGKRDIREFMKGWGEFEGNTGEQYVQAQLNKAQRVKDDKAAWRQSQDDAYNALDYKGRHSVALGMKELFRKNPQLKRQLTESGVGRGYNQAHKAMSRLLASSNIGSEDFDIDDFHSIRDGLEAAGVNPSEYFTFLQKKKEAPTKRTPLYRMYKDMWKNK